MRSQKEEIANALERGLVMDEGEPNGDGPPPITPDAASSPPQPRAVAPQASETRPRAMVPDAYAVRPKRFSFWDFTARFRWVIGAVLLGLLLLFIFSGDDPESAKERMIQTSERMGGPDKWMVQMAISEVEKGRHRTAGWQWVDTIMAQASPETRNAYRRWRKAMIVQDR